MSAYISIVIPVYNVAAYLPRTVRSVQAQPFVDWEIVLVDDGSTDGSADVCDQFAAEDARIKVVHQLNGGVVEARRVGFETSSGEWVLFLDGDDELSPDILDRVRASLRSEDVDILRVGFVMIRAGGTCHDYLPPINQSNVLEELMSSVRDTPLELIGTCIGDKIYRRSIAAAAFRDVGDLKLKHSEDGLFALAALLNAKTYVTLPVIGYRYYLRSGSAVHQFNVDLAREKDAFIDRAVALVESSPYASDSLLPRMRTYHAYEAFGFLYSCVLRWQGTAGQVLALLKSAQESRFIRDAQPLVTTFPRRIKMFLIKHSLSMLFYRYIFQLRRRGICD